MAQLAFFRLAKGRDQSVSGLGIPDVPLPLIIDDKRRREEQRRQPFIQPSIPEPMEEPPKDIAKREVPLRGIIIIDRDEDDDARSGIVIDMKG